MNPSSDSSPSFVTTIDLKLSDKLFRDLTQQEFEISKPPYTKFSAKKKGITCTLYESGKLVVQGKERRSFIEFYLEPEILGSFQFTHPLAAADLTPRIGIDESGKGDFFGPLCIAGVYVRTEDFSELQAIGVKDSKSITDVNICKIAAKIKDRCLYHIVKINPLKYNEIYLEFKNLNRLLAWGHATTIEQLVIKSGCREVLIDQFADEWVVQSALKRKQLEVNLTQRHRAEQDLAVAAASILARQSFLEGLEKLGREMDIILPKGASSSVIQAGKKIIQKWGVEGLRRVCKQHFKTFEIILNKEAAL
jgi:ribonuclease HIII